MRDKGPHHIVVDTNVLISAGLLPNSVSAQALILAFDNYVVAQNQATWAELQDKLTRKKFDKYFGESGRLALLAQIAQNSEFFDEVAIATESRDPSDNKFLALALDATAVAILSGDQDLRVLNPYRNIPIYSPQEFLKAMAGE